MSITYRDGERFFLSLYNGELGSKSARYDPFETDQRTGDILWPDNTDCIGQERLPEQWKISHIKQFLESTYYHVTVHQGKTDLQEIWGFEKHQWLVFP